MTRPGSTQAAPTRAACWSTTWPRSGELDRPALVGEGSGALRRCPGPRAGPRAGSEDLAEALVEAGGAELVKLCARGGRGVGGEPRAEAVAEEGVDGAHPQGSGRREPSAPPGRARAARPSSRRRSRGRRGSPLSFWTSSLLLGRGRSRTSWERLSCQTTIGRERRARSRRPRRAPTRPGGRGRRRPPRRRAVVEQLRNRLHDRAAAPPRRSCSTQPGCGWRFPVLSRRASRTCRSCSSNRAALTPVVPSSMPRSSKPRNPIG